jgi:hypothetical protein
VKEDEPRKDLVLGTTIDMPSHPEEIQFKDVRQARTERLSQAKIISRLSPEDQALVAAYERKPKKPILRRA